MSEIFTPLPQSERGAFRARYLEHLKRRDGTPDQARHTFDIREEFFQDLEANPVRWQGRPIVDPEVFRRNLDGKLEEGLDEATLWALAVAKVNRAERFGVEYGFALHGSRADGAEDPYTYTEIEETYHTRILRDAVETLGLRMEMQPPPTPTRLVIQGMVRLPRGISNVLVLAGEIGGVVIFQKLLEKARELFSAQPEVLGRIEALFEQILVDELGHVYFLRSTLDPPRLWAAKRSLPLVLANFLRDSPEVVRLFGREALLREMRRADIPGILARYPEAAHFADRLTPSPAAAPVPA
jgi:hypothetical protein